MTVLSLFSLPFVALILTLWSSSAFGSPDYHEHLLLQPLPQSSLLASFNFRSNTSQQSFDQQHFRYLPRALGQILQHAHTKELHLRFTTGRWDAESWGPRPWNGSKEGGTGVELWAWIDAPSDEEAFAKWITLTQSLSGLFCASLNFVDSTRTTRPVVSFEPAGDHSAADQLHLLHGTLPGEVVCTENLTPFLKLLPCKGKAGISSLFDGHKLFDAAWQSMSVDIQPVCSADGECVVQIEQTVDMVLDIDRSKRYRSNPIPRPVPNEQLVCDTSKSYNSDDTCYPLEKTSDKSWSLTEVFGRSLTGVCPLADIDGSSDPSVCLRVPHERGVFISEEAVETKKDDGFTRCFKLAPSASFDLSIPQQPVNTEVPLDEPVLHAERTIVGHGQERGGMRIIFGNPSNTSAVDFIYFESLPWFLRPYIHTLRATITEHDGVLREVPTTEIVKETYYRPAIDRERGTQLELALSVPAASTVTLTYDFEKAILRYTEYPPDANRGFNVAPAVIRIVDRAHNAPIYIRSTSLLLQLPTPDFSMPYNVIILTSTVIALAFGTIFNILVRRVVSLDEAAALGAQTLKARILGKLVAIRDRLRGKGTKVE
ncbi:Gpi16 subunit GPI transamidase component [Penicillium cf. griseofulvum]|uniref:Gpi16 subunit GPI transamidase component n=1 Tax=Penicillium cf. griseofulvum TaxID=2972120 RepID=A0A9W9J5B7_9EURO|nr:Gpi16 subunit GPI transamidase component [Penicillium cf. griseofulvum]KAJ5435221.1 Gpi16 subunit GPI transamidase component [Penicillium cf. griseofulvum]KAJ5453054.1 Gpi16 subunit GPI transamidase component [Penicillium cf. griseofulvum]